jgi:hypothetical protein
MLTLYTKRTIKFAVVEKPTCWLVYGVVFETRGNEQIAITEPRIVKVITKARAALPGTVVSPFALFGQSIAVQTPTGIISPYTAHVDAQHSFLAWYYARPPTRV